MSNFPRALPTAKQFDRRLIVRRWQFAMWAVFLTGVSTALFLGLNGNVLIPGGIISAIVLIGLAWMFPRSIFFVMLIGSCVVETYPQNFKDSTTDLIPLFWDVNTIVQMYLKMSNFHGIAFSFFEILLIIAGLAWFIRGIYYKTLRLDLGTLFVPILLYVVCVVGGLLNGMSTGGQFNIALFEVRAQFYFLIAYLMAINSARNPQAQTNVLLWCTAIAIGFKGMLCTYRFLVTLKGVTIPEIGIGAHEESFFFDCFVFELLVLKLAGLQPKLRRTMLCLLPFVLIANLANERRAATAALAIAIMALLALAAFAFPQRRAAIAITSVIICVVSAIYLPIFWNSSSTFAQPARAIKSQFSPDPRDASSNAYRDAENINLLYTMKIDPIFGFGYGKPIYIVAPMEDLTKVDPLVHYMTHNQILWVWMRLGCLGFYFFWIMVCSILIQGCQLLRNPEASVEARAAALLGVLIIIMQMVFGLLDLQISNVRNMLFCGLWAGTISLYTAACQASASRKLAEVVRTDKPASAVRWNLPTRGQAQL